MYYDSIENKHGLKHDPFKALIAPRPIGWISTVSADGICNLAPYSFFNAVSDRPPYVMFSSADIKDSIRNIEQTGEFTCSMATWDTRQGMNISSASVPADTDEFPLSGLTPTASNFVKPPRVMESPAAFECRHWKTVPLPDVVPGTEKGHFVVIGHVVGIYIDDQFIDDGMVNTGAMQPIARMGYMEYSVVRPETVFAINRPTVNSDGTLADVDPGEWDGVYRCQRTRTERVCRVLSAPKMFCRQNDLLSCQSDATGRVWFSLPVTSARLRPRVGACLRAGAVGGVCLCLYSKGYC